ncbi:unnamed protein product [Schistosoma curassoni]|uniref:NERD domain-containing protein n=1 Tax=Schistosoma curassoni TaxID=6186 RepID=A0A183JK14_9TREM|nr:unnamed protein product [Schistosoma curassoni]
MFSYSNDINAYIKVKTSTEFLYIDEIGIIRIID